MESAREDMQDQRGDASSKFTVDDYAPKARKPYTITKQRQSWTEEEHQKFLEALKLYGRAWKHIEEHIATKTAVQIRSHAQKFFTKLARESSGNEENIGKPIEVPPPRPKRKHMHPYPRNIVKVNSGTSVMIEDNISSPNFLISGQETQSPGSVLSALGSEITGATDSNLPHDALSPASSTADDQLSKFYPPETLPSEEPKSKNSLSSPVSSIDEEQIPKVKSKKSEEDGGLLKDQLNKDQLLITRSLKLFGKTLIVTGSDSSYSDNYQPRRCEETDRRSAQLTSWNLMMGPSTVTDAEHPQTGLCGEQAAHYYMEIRNENSNTVAVGSSSTSLLYRNFYGGASYPFLPRHTAVPEKNHIDSIKTEEFQDKEVEKNERMVRLNTGSGDAPAHLEPQAGCTRDSDRRWNVETQSGKNESASRLEFVLKPSKVKAKCLKGFAPYKRCLPQS